MSSRTRAVVLSRFMDGWSVGMLAVWYGTNGSAVEQIIRDTMNRPSKAKARR